MTVQELIDQLLAIPEEDRKKLKVCVFDYSTECYTPATDVISIGGGKGTTIIDIS